MFKRGNKIFFVFVLFLSLINVSMENINWIYERNKNAYCPDRDKVCYANITYNNPYTPKIPKSYLRTAILSPNYYYIYLIFDLPNKTTQNKFFLEAIDISRDKSVISNGDCYLIELKNKFEYELRIYETLFSNSTIQIKFFGLNQGFAMNLQIKFAKDLNIYFYGIMLTDENSLGKSNTQEYIVYEKELKQKIENQNERKKEAIEKANTILTNLFKKTLGTDIEFKETIFSDTIPVTPFLLVTVTIAVGLEASTENILVPNEEETISSAISLHGDISLESDMFDKILGDNLSVDNTVLNLMKIYNKIVEDIILNLGLDTDDFSLSISKSLTKPYTALTFRFYDVVTHKIFYEIEIKVELTNKWILDLMMQTQEAFSQVLNKITDFNEKYGKDIDIFIYVLIGVIVILSLIFLSIPAIVGLLSSIAAGLASLAHSLPEIGFEKLAYSAVPALAGAYI